MKKEVFDDKKVLGKDEVTDYKLDCIIEVVEQNLFVEGFAREIYCENTGQVKKEIKEILEKR